MVLETVLWSLWASVRGPCPRKTTHSTKDYGHQHPSTLVCGTPAPSRQPRPHPPSRPGM